MKRRLYDFTPLLAVVTIVAYAFLISVFAFLAATVDTPVPYIVVVCVIVATFVALLWLFVFRAPRLTDTHATYGKLSIERASVKYDIYYSIRYREIKLRLRDTNQEYVGGNDTKAVRGREIVVQATKGNMRRLGKWLGCEITIPPEALPRRKKGNNNL